MWFLSTKTILERLNDQTISDEKKSKLLKRSKNRLILEINDLSAEDLLSYLFNSNLSDEVKDLIYNKIVKIGQSYYSENKEKYILIKKIFREKYLRESLLNSDYCLNDFKSMIIDEVYDSDLFSVVGEGTISAYKKKLIIDLKISSYSIDKLLVYDLSRELIDFILEKKLTDDYIIKNCLNNQDISVEARELIIKRCINVDNIFNINSSLYRNKTINLLEERKDLVEECFNNATSENILKYFTNHYVPKDFRNRLFTYKFDEIKKAIFACDKKKLKETFFSSSSYSLCELIFEDRKDVCYEIASELDQDELIIVLNKDCVPEEFKRIVIDKNKDRIIEKIKTLTYKDLTYWYLTGHSSIPRDIQDIMIKIHHDMLFNEIRKIPKSSLDTEIKYSNKSLALLEFILKVRYDEKMTIDLLSSRMLSDKVIDLIFDVKSAEISNYVMCLPHCDLFTLGGFQFSPQIRDRIVLQNNDYIAGVINQLSMNEKYELLNNRRVGGIFKQILLGNFGINELDINECLTLLTKGNAEVLINNFCSIKDCVLNSNINFSTLLQYGAGSKKHSEWLNNLSNIVINGEIDNFIKCKNYFFNNYYVDLYEKENEVYTIESFLEIIDGYTRYRDLMISMASGNKVLSEQDKMNLRFLFKVSIPEGIEAPKNLEELSSFKQKIYSGYIEKINSGLLDEQELKNIFNNLLFCDSKAILDSIGGTGALRTLKKDNINNLEIGSLIDDVILYGRVIEMVNDTNNVFGLEKVLKYVFSDIDTLTKFQNLFSDFEVKVSKLYEMDSSYNLTSLDDARKIGAVDLDLSNQYGREVFDLSDKNYVLYAHVLSRNEGVEDIINGVSSGEKNFISVSPISYRGQMYYWGRSEVIFAYNKIPNGSFVGSSIANMGSNGFISKNSSEVRIVNTQQRGILECSSTTKNNAEALLYREGFKPCGLILPGGRTPTDVELAIHDEYGLPFIVTQEIGKPIEEAKMVFNTDVIGIRRESFSNGILEEIVELLKPNVSISKEDDVYTGREVAIFTDCHSMFEPTLAVLDDIRRHGITEIYSLGDNVGLGPNPCEVFDLLEEYGVISVAGNSEYYNILGIEPFDYFYEDKKISQAWTEAKLGRERIKRMEVYPASIDLVLGGERLALCHFANDVRWDYREHSTHSYQAMYDTGHGAEQFLYTNSEACKKKIRNCITSHKKGDKRAGGYVSAKETPLFGGKLVTDYDAIIQGHVHFDREDEIEGTKIHTLRAVGMGYEEDGSSTACYYVFKEKKDGSFDKEKRLVTFNKNNLMSSIYSSSLPNKEAVLRYVKS